MIKSTAKNITVSSSIIINKDVHSVFSYVADLRLDKNWRKEINDTTLSTASPELSSIATESTFLSKKVPDNKIKLKCTIYQQDDLVVHESLPDEPLYLMNSRQVEPMPDNTTRLTYTIEFDTAIVKFGIGFNLPLFLLKYYTTQTMNKYLRQLKQILESQKEPVL